MTALAAESWTWYAVTWVVVLMRMYVPDPIHLLSGSMRRVFLPNYRQMPDYRVSQGPRVSSCKAPSGSCSLMMP
jgi:hypothetical protein